MEDVQRLMEDAEMLSDVKAYDAAKARIESGENELIPLEITERRLRGEAALRIWREHRKLTQERLAKKAKVSRALIAAIEAKRKAVLSAHGRSWALRSMWAGSNWPEANRFRFRLRPADRGAVPT